MNPNYFGIKVWLLSSICYRDSVMGLERKICKNGCGSPDLTTFRRPKVYAVRGFPIGCGPPKRYCTDSTRNTNWLGTLVKEYDSNPKDRLVVSCDEKVEVESVRKVKLGETGVFNDSRLVNQSKFSVDETTDSQRKAAVTKTRFYPRCRRISAIRIFPPGCGTEAARINTEIAPESAALKTSGFSHEIPGLEMTVFKMNGEATESHGSQKNTAITHDRNMFQSDTECWKIRREKRFKNDVGTCSDGKLSGQHHMINQFLERAPSSLENPAPRLIVHALMAPSWCTWTRRTTAFTAKLISDLAQRKV